MKTCKKCGMDETQVGFPEDRLVCIDCRKKERSEAYQRNRDKIVKKRAERYQERKAIISVQAKEWYKKNSDKVKAASLEYYYSNQEKISAQRKSAYAENPEPAKDRAQKRRDARLPSLIEFVEQVKSQPCARCKIAYPSAAMDFHHVRGDKTAAISSMIYSLNYSIEEISEEIDKCELICANCHRLEHSGERGSSSSSHLFHIFE